MTKPEKELLSILERYINDESDKSFNGVFGSNGEKLKTPNPKTVEGLLRWLKSRL